MSPPGLSRRRDACLRNVITTSLYTDHNYVKTDQFVQLIPGLNDEFDTNEPGDDVMALFHTVKPPGNSLSQTNFYEILCVKWFFH